MPKLVKSITQTSELSRDEGDDVSLVTDPCSLESTLFSIRSKIPVAETAFFHVSLCSVVRQWQRWCSLLPRVQPLYAVKCQPDPNIVRLLARLGAGFDCASQAEIKIVTRAMRECGRTDPVCSSAITNNVIYANPYKFKKDMRFAERAGVAMTTFDSESELVRLASEWPSAKLVLRVSPERQYDATCVLGNKFGANANEIPGLLQRAKQLGLDVIGLSFHVGSGCREMDAFPETVQFCARLMTMMRHELGFAPYLLDIGGGFPGLSAVSGSDCDKQQEWETMCVRLSAALDEYFPADAGFRVVAEPGRFFVMGAYTLATQIIGKRCTSMLDPSTTSGVVACAPVNHGVTLPDSRQYPDNMEYSGASSVMGIDTPSIEYMSRTDSGDDLQLKETNLKEFRYVLTDGVYNSFNSIIYDHATPMPLGRYDDEGNFIPFGVDTNTHVSTLYGPTCDGFDCILQQVQLPELAADQWLVWPDMGAYTSAAASGFNGIAPPRNYYELCPLHLAYLEECAASLCLHLAEAGVDSTTTQQQQNTDLDPTSVATASVTVVPAVSSITV